MQKTIKWSSVRKWICRLVATSHVQKVLFHGLIHGKPTWCTFLLQVLTQGGIKSIVFLSFCICTAPCHELRVRCWIITQIHIFMPIPMLSAANLSAGKKEKGKHLVVFVTSKQIGVEKGRAGDGRVSLCGLLRTIVPSYLLETGCTVTACSGRPCLFVFRSAGSAALRPPVEMQGFQIKAGLLALSTSWNNGKAVVEQRLLCDLSWSVCI